MVKFPTDQQVSLDLSYKSYATNDDINNNIDAVALGSFICV